MEGIFMNTNINKLIRKLMPFAFIILSAYVLTSIASTFLPKSGVEFVDESSNSMKYRNYLGFYSQSASVKKVQQQKIQKKQEVQTLSTYILKAIFSTQSNGGWILVENKRDRKTKILSQYEKLDGYLLTKLYKNHVIFEKSAKQFKLEMKKSDNSKVKYKIERKVNNITENIIVSDDIVKVKRNYLNSYVKDIDKVWNNIAIKEIEKNGKIDGFRVNAVNQKSVFGKLGLKVGDVIKAVNNNTLNSYADAFKVYNNINKMKYLNIEILRDNEIMELNYEID